MKRVSVILAMVMAGCIGLGVTVNPGYFKSLIIGGGCLDADGGITLGNDGTACISGDAKFSSNVQIGGDLALAGDFDVGPAAADQAYTVFKPHRFDFQPATAWTRNVPFSFAQADGSLNIVANDTADYVLEVINTGAGRFSVRVDGNLHAWGSFATGQSSITVSATTFDVIGRSFATLSATSPQSVGLLTGGIKGQRVTLMGSSNTNTVTLVDGAYMVLVGSANAVLGLYDTIELVCYNDLVWVELTRSDN